MWPPLSRALLRPHLGSVLRTGHHATRTVSQKVHRLPPAAGGGEHNPDDFRPPWFYTMVRMLSWTTIPATVFYAVFFYDFGDHEHVFQAPRRWAAQKKAEFLTLSPQEKSIIGEEQTTEQAK